MDDSYTITGPFRALENLVHDVNGEFLCLTRNEAKATWIADALNRVSVLDDENRRLRKQCEKLDELELTQCYEDAFKKTMVVASKHDIVVEPPKMAEPITRRDLFAAAAMAASAVTSGIKVSDEEAEQAGTTVETLRKLRARTARACLDMADAMVAEAERRAGQEKKGGG